MATCAIGREGDCLLTQEKELLERTLSELLGKPVTDILQVTECDDTKCAIDYIINSLSNLPQASQYAALIHAVQAIRELSILPDGPASDKQMMDNFILFRVSRQICRNVGENCMFGGLLMLDFATDSYKTIWNDPMSVYESYNDVGWNQLHIILNTDSSKGIGKHWQLISVCLDAMPMSLEFFDSYGQPPPSGETRGSDGTTFVSKLPLWLDEVTKIFTYNKLPLTFKFNHTGHQEPSDHVNCGVYCLMEMERRCAGESMEQISSRPVGKKEITKLREKYFLPEEDYDRNVTPPERLPEDASMPM